VCTCLDSYLDNLVSLGIAKNNLPHMPKELATLTALTELDAFENNMLGEIPSDLCASITPQPTRTCGVALLLLCVSVLCACFVCVTGMHAATALLAALWCSKCHTSHVRLFIAPPPPPSVSMTAEARQLWTLDLGKNSLDYIPVSLRFLTNLTDLDLSFNNLCGLEDRHVLVESGSDTDDEAAADAGGDAGDKASDGGGAGGTGVGAGAGAGGGGGDTVMLNDDELDGFPALRKPMSRRMMRTSSRHRMRKRLLARCVCPEWVLSWHACVCGAVVVPAPLCLCLRLCLRLLIDAWCGLR